ncbi:hypothetical protein TEK04_01150 [Klenkia sp. LSe6-5]|uniref:Uncharacterized protein n=1 Tax=Klenkia sesuvii TaxID=3103137 RepID=A0ABU8DPF2_9ACTN
MAIFLAFEKESETATEVVYRFGGAEDPTAHLVSIPRDDPSRAPMPQGISPALTQKVIGRVVLRAGREGAWPDRGRIQS